MFTATYVSNNTKALFRATLKLFKKSYTYFFLIYDPPNQARTPTCTQLHKDNDIPIPFSNFAQHLVPSRRRPEFLRVRRKLCQRGVRCGSYRSRRPELWPQQRQRTACGVPPQSRQLSIVCRRQPRGWSRVSENELILFFRVVDMFWGLFGAKIFFLVTAADTYRTAIAVVV